MVGTAVYQLGLTSANQAKNLNALNPGVHTTEAPAEIEDSVAAISPWMWNSGMMLRHTSSGVSASVVAMWCAEAVTLRWVSGTIFGRDVVPEVCSTSAMSSACAVPGCAAVPDSGVTGSRVNDPAGAPGTSSTSGTPARAAASRAGVSAPRSTSIARGFRSDR